MERESERERERESERKSQESLRVRGLWGCIHRVVFLVFAFEFT